MSDESETEGKHSKAMIFISFSRKAKRGCLFDVTFHYFFQASIVGHKYGVLRWSKTGSKYFLH